MTKKLIKEYVCSLYIDLDGDRVKEVVDQLNKLLTEHEDTLVFEKEKYYQGHPATQIMKERLETDEEYAERIEKEAEFDKFQKERDLRVLAELKAKYGEV